MLLVIGHKFAAFDAARQRGFQFAAIAQIGFNGFGKPRVAVPPAALGLIHGDVCAVQHGFGCNPFDPLGASNAFQTVGTRQSKRHGDPPAVTIGFDRLAHLGDDPFGKVVQLLGVSGVEGGDAGEFIAAKARQQRRCGQDPAYPARAFQQHRIASRMAAQIVDLFEVIEVDHQHACRLSAGMCGGDQAIGGCVDGAPVEATRKGVCFGQQARLFLGLAAFLHLVTHFVIPAPAKDDQRDIQQ